MISARARRQRRKRRLEDIIGISGVLAVAGDAATHGAEELHPDITAKAAYAILRAGQESMRLLDEWAAAGRAQA